MASQVYVGNAATVTIRSKDAAGAETVLTFRCAGFSIDPMTGQDLGMLDLYRSSRIRRRLRVEMFDAMSCDPVEKEREKSVSDIEALKRALRNDHWLNLNVLADWYHDQGDSALSDAYRWLVENRKRPVWDGLWRWYPFNGDEQYSYDHSHILPDGCVEFVDESFKPIGWEHEDEAYDFAAKALVKVWGR